MANSLCVTQTGDEGGVESPDPPGDISIGHPKDVLASPCAAELGGGCVDHVDRSVACTVALFREVVASSRAIPTEDEVRVDSTNPSLDVSVDVTSPCFAGVGDDNRMVLTSSVAACPFCSVVLRHISRIPRNS